MIYLILPLNRKKTIKRPKTMIKIRITIWMLHTITERLKIGIDINIELSRSVYVDNLLLESLDLL